MGWQLIRQQDSARLVEAARRIAVVDWFRLPEHPLERGPRLAAALERHLGQLPGGKAPDAVEILDPAQGLEQLPRALAASAAWIAKMNEVLEGPRTTWLRRPRRDDGPFLVSGDSLMLRRGALPIDRQRVRERLAACLGDHPRLVTELLDRLLWQMGALLLWEAVGAGENPFEPLLAIYEEGLCPLDLTPARALLWIPAAA